MINVIRALLVLISSWPCLVLPMTMSRSMTMSMAVTLTMA